MLNKDKNIKAFTLIELLIVVVIIGVLAGMVFVMIQGVIDRARMARSKSFARSIQRQLALNEVGVWRFDDDPQPGVTDGVHDASGWGNHGTLHIGATGCPAEEGGTWQEGVFGKAICFDGVDDFVEVPHDASLDFGTGDFTLEAWIKSSSPAWQIIADKRGPESGWIRFSLGTGVREGKLKMEIAAGVLLVSTAVINDGLWHHVVVVRSGDR